MHLNVHIVMQNFQKNQIVKDMKEYILVKDLLSVGIVGKRLYKNHHLLDMKKINMKRLKIQMMLL